MRRPRLSGVRYVPARSPDAASGLLGFISFQIGSLRVDGVKLRRTRDGRLALSYPARRDSNGQDHPYLRPLDDRARQYIEHQVFAALGLQEVAP